MSSSVYIPAASGGGSFTPPASVSVKTASYTIPAGRYARIVAECDSGGTLTINAVTAITTAAFVNIDVGSAISPSYTTPSGYMAKMCVIGDLSAGTFTLNGNISGVVPDGRNVTYSNMYEVGPAGTMTTGGGIMNKSIQGVAIPSNATNRQGQFYVPTGTVISGTGNWRAVVEEYTV